MIDFIEFLEIDKTLLVTSNALGSINDTLLSIEALENRKLSFDWCVNLYDNKEDFKKIIEKGSYRSYSRAF